MPHFDYLLRALMISIPLGIVIGLLATCIRKRYGNALVEKHASNWETVRRAIFGTGILMFAVLAGYCHFVIDQPYFAWVYGIMSLMNGICLTRSFSKGWYNQDGVPVHLERKPKRVTPAM